MGPIKQKRRDTVELGGLRSSAPAFGCFAEDGELVVTFSLATGLLGQTALGAKKVSFEKFQKVRKFHVGLRVRAFDA